MLPSSSSVICYFGVIHDAFLELGDVVHLSYLHTAFSFSVSSFVLQMLINENDDSDFRGKIDAEVKLPL